MPLIFQDTYNVWIWVLSIALFEKPWNDTQGNPILHWLEDQLVYKEDYLIMYI